MCETVNKFIDLMKPFVLNIQEDYSNLKEKENAFQNLDKILELVDNNSFKIFDIEFELLIKLLDGFKSNKKEFEANKYILKTEVDEVKSLPQYINAKRYIDDFFNYLLSEFSKLETEYQKLNSDYEKQKLVNKYYEMFINENVFVDNEEEIKEIFNILDIKYELRNGILIYILKENSKFYYNDNAQTFTDFEKEKALDIIKDNEELNNKNYNELIDIVGEYVDLTKKINEIIDYDLIKKINVCNIVLAKKIWLYRKIKFAYYNMNCNKCNSIIKEFNDICRLYEKIRLMKNQEEVIKIIKGEN